VFELPKDGILPISTQTEASEQSLQVATHFLLLHKIKTFSHPKKVLSIKPPKNQNHHHKTKNNNDNDKTPPNPTTPPLP